MFFNNYYRILLGNHEVDDLLFDTDAIRSYGLFEQPAINAYKGMAGFFYRHLEGAIGMDGAMVEKTAGDEQPQTAEQLHQLWVIDNGDIEHAIIGHGTGGLAISMGVAHTDGHHPAVYRLVIHVQPHLVVLAVEYLQNNGHDEREGTGPEDTACLLPEVHDVGRRADVNTVQEIPMMFHALLVGKVYASQVYLAASVGCQPAYGLGIVRVGKSPVAGKIVQAAVGYYTQHHLLADATFFMHEAVDGIVQGRVSANDDDGFVAIADQHGSKTFYAVAVLTLHHVVVDAVCIKLPLQAFPPFTLALDSFFGAIENAPSRLFYCHIFNILLIFLSMVSVASIQ